MSRDLIGAKLAPALGGFKATGVYLSAVFLMGLLYTLSQRTMLESEADAPQPIPPQGT